MSPRAEAGVLKLDKTLILSRSTATEKNKRKKSSDIQNPLLFTALASDRERRGYVRDSYKLKKKHRRSRQLLERSKVRYIIVPAKASN